MGISAVVVAAGYGSLEGNGGAPKILERLGRRSLVGRAVAPLHEAHIWSIVVVANPMFAVTVKTILREEKVPCTDIVVQPDRLGSADAVVRAIPTLERFDCKDVLVTYGDMPAWRAETVRRLIHTHRNTGAAITMVVVRLGGDAPNVLRRYGRVIRDSSGGIQRIVEVQQANQEESTSPWVNPSLWIWDLDWFKANVSRLVPRAKEDGRSPESHLPELIEFASMDGRTIAEVALDDPFEALGVNTRSEMEFVRNAWREAKIAR